MTSTQTYRIFQVVFAVAMLIATIGWLIAYSYASDQSDQCTQTFKELSESIQVRSKNVQARIDKVKVRQESLQARRNQQ